MGDANVVARLGSMKALLGIVAGAGASYGIYKLVFGRAGDAGVNRKKSAKSVTIQPGSLTAKVSGFKVVSKSDNLDPSADTESSDILSKSAASLEPRHLSMLLSLLQSSPNPEERRKVLVTLGNAAAFTVNQDLLREFGGLPIIAGFLSDPSPEIRVQTLNALNNLSMNIRNQEQLKIYVPSVMQMIEMSPVNSDLQLAALRLLTNLSVTDNHQHLMKNSITLLLSLLIVSNEVLQIQVLKVLVNISSNPDLMDDIVQAQAPASLILLFDGCTSTSVLLRLLFFVGNLHAWRPSAQVAEALRRRQDSLYCVLLDSSSQLHRKLPLLLSHPDEEVKTQVARLLT
ncbi:armadillo repeat-containing protein 10-like [Sinocyclocheilus anshuiensis]|uniref:Armadillo repeat-containing protein 10-like n=1 Tax=Sinocyclocheilus anshuiensis TaxID=1608454 RepID=A0A671PMD0_9TELE|nr:PREDICTED: armadillo repeat-containing protein 10-like [Sinocyclocheilus anshuiensis]